MRKTLKLIALYCTGIALANLALLFFRAVLAPPLPLYHFNKPVKLLVLAAHQDDEVIQAGGLLLKNIALGGSSTIAFLTSPAIPSDAAIRENEARRIWEVFGEKKPLLHFMRFPSQSWWPDNAKAEARASLRAVIENAQPELIVIPLEERGSYEHDLLNNLSWSLAPDFPDVRWLQAAEYNPFYLAEESPAKLLWFMIRLLPFVPYREPNYGLYPEQQLVLAMSSAELTNKKKLLLGYVSQRDIIPLSQFAYPDLFEETRHIPQNVSKIFGKYVSNYALISILLVFAALFLTGIWIGLSARAGACLIVISALIPACVFASARPILIKEQLLLVAAVAAGFILMCCLRGFRFYASRRGRGINGNRSIAIVCHLYPPSYGGTQRFMQWLAEELKSDGMTVTVLTSAGNSLDSLETPHIAPQNLALEDEDRVCIVRYSIGGISWQIKKCTLGLLRRLKIKPHWLLSSYPVIRLLFGLLSRTPDIIVVSPFVSDLANVVLIAGRIMRAKTVLFPAFHISGSDKGRIPPATISTIAKFERILVYTDHEYQELLSLGLDPSTLETTGLMIQICGTNPDTLPPLPDALKGFPYIIFVGRLVPEKGIETLIAAFEMIDPGLRAKLVIAGASSRYFTANIKPRLSTRADVLVFENPSEDFKQRLIQSAQVLCLVSANESFGIAYLEAWNHRLPVIGVNNMTSRCLIDDGINGILVPYGDANQLAARISSLLENPTVARSLGEAGHRKLQQLFADDVAKRRILDAIFN